MDKLEFADLRYQLTESIYSFINRYFSAAKKRSNYWECGDKEGNKGQSLKIWTNGTWEDFATGEQGDLLDMFTYFGGSKFEGIRQAKEFLGIDDCMQYKPKFTKPTQDWKGMTKGAANYFSNRGLDPLVAKKCGVKWRDGCVVYVHSVDGEECLAVYKRVDKKESFCSKDGKAVLWGMDLVPEEVGCSGCPGVVIVEGHEDALALIQCGIFAVSIPMGAANTKWIDYCWDWIKDQEKIIFCFDNDEPGAQLTEIASRRIGIGRCWKMTFDEHKDANAALKDGGQAAIIKAYSSIEEIKPAGAKEASFYIGTIKKNWKEKRELKGQLLFDKPDFKLRLRERESTIVTGTEGSGKSNFIYQLIAFLLGKKKRCAVFSLEEDPDVVSSLIYGHMMGEPAIAENESFFDYCVNYAAGNLFVYDYRGNIPVDEFFEATDYFTRRFNVDYIVLDSLMKTSLNIEKNDDANDFIGRMHEVIAKGVAHWLMVAHSRKGDYSSIKNIPGSHDIKGSVSLPASVFNILSIWRNQEKQRSLEWAKVGKKKNPDPTSPKKYIDLPPEDVKKSLETIGRWPDNIYSLTKQKVGGAIGRVDLYYNQQNYRFRTGYHEMDQPYVEYEEDDED